MTRLKYCPRIQEQHNNNKKEPKTSHSRLSGPIKNVKVGNTLKVMNSLHAHSLQI